MNGRVSLRYITSQPGATPSLSAWLGYGPINTPPDNGGWAWIPGTYKGDNEGYRPRRCTLFSTCGENKRWVGHGAKIIIFNGGTVLRHTDSGIEQVLESIDQIIFQYVFYTIFNL